MGSQQLKTEESRQNFLHTIFSRILRDYTKSYSYVRMSEIYILSFVDSKELGRLQIDAVLRKQYMLEESSHLWRPCGSVLGGFQVTGSSKFSAIGV